MSKKKRKENNRKERKKEQKHDPIQETKDKRTSAHIPPSVLHRIALTFSQIKTPKNRTL